MSEHINNREYRQKILKELIGELHEGKSVEEVKARFADLIEGQGCPSCDTCQPNIFTKEEWIIQTFDEIEELKKRISKQEAKIKLLRGMVKRLKKE